ncbi:hypothetical protein [Nesterenkonia xinjiangensis]|uniref:PknH-like protein n=1 Tax=Nesterenkonia xinjiangensis TaxID=225327 RepID=A0A7Z0GMD0_9MICC|nr:hypothetical protein [Nesterenkonia xinjiangensis]NYJ78626.1 hypothetical protein [Nesterenkonia xinjiangensis]
MSRHHTPTPEAPHTGPRTGPPSRGAVVPAALLTVVLALSGCGADEGAGEEGEQSPRAGTERLIGAAEAGMERASSFGFDSAGFYTEAAVEEFRDQMEGSLAEGEADVDVEPASCEEPLAAVDWAPLLLGSDAARVDFGSETFTGTGSIEIAEIDGEDEASRAQEHMGHVQALVESCPEVRLTQLDADYVLAMDEVSLETLEPARGQGEGTVAYSRSRTLAEGEDDGMIAAQILFTRQGDDVVMVSFIGEPAASSQEFTTMAEAITVSTLEALEG